MKCMKNESLETYQEKKKLEKGLKNLKEEVWSEKESVWEMNRHGQIERDQRNEKWIAKRKYIHLNKSQQIQVSRGIKESIEIGIEKIVVDS